MEYFYKGDKTLNLKVLSMEAIIFGNPSHQKLRDFKILIFLALKICSDSKLFNNEITYIKATAINCGFSLNIIDRILSKIPTVTGSVRVNKEFKNVIFLPLFLKISTLISYILNKFSSKVNSFH